MFSSPLTEDFYALRNTPGSLGDVGDCTSVAPKRFGFRAPCRLVLMQSRAAESDVTIVQVRNWSRSPSKGNKHFFPLTLRTWDAFLLVKYSSLSRFGSRMRWYKSQLVCSNQGFLLSPLFAEEVAEALHKCLYSLWSLGLIACSLARTLIVDRTWDGIDELYFWHWLINSSEDYR